jgi:hypothetical protein
LHAVRDLLGGTLAVRGLATVPAFATFGLSHGALLLCR